MWPVQVADNNIKIQQNLHPNYAMRFRRRFEQEQHLEQQILFLHVELSSCQMNSNNKINKKTPHYQLLELDLNCDPTRERST
jgi:hypothetical protein